MPATIPPAAFVGTGGRLRSERVPAFNRNPRPQSSESAGSVQATSSCKNTTVNIAEITHGEKLLSGMTFERCLIRGPAYLRLQFQNVLEQPSVPNEPDKSFLALSEGTPILGAIVLSRNLFKQSHFENITFVGTDRDNTPLMREFENISTSDWKKRYWGDSSK
jgi:hypothetical protein